MTYVLDTNIVSYFIQEDARIISKLRSVLAANHSIVLSPATYYEIWRGFKHKPSPKKEKAFIRMCELYPIGKMDLAIWGKAADIYAAVRKAGRPIEDTDILIAAFCVVNDYVLATNNTKHFTNVDGLDYENWVTEVI